MKDGKIELIDIISDHVKGEHIVWEGPYCFYKEYEIVAVFGREVPTSVWVRSSMPDNRDKIWLKPADPDFIAKLDAAVTFAIEVVEYSEETKRAMANLRANMLDGKPMPGRIA